MSFIGGLGGLIGLGIAATAAFTLINITGNQLAQCKVCGYTNPNRQMVVKHLQVRHPEQLRVAHANLKRTRSKKSQRRRSTYTG
jgi:hypothetical protein